MRRFKFSVIARPIANMIAFVDNVRVGPIEAHLAFDSDPDRSERQVVEVFLPDERGGFAQGRIIPLPAPRPTGRSSRR